MVVALTVTLSLVSRSITNIKTSTEQANSQKALSAAEAGIERTLKSGAAIGTDVTLPNGTSYTTTITQVSGATEFWVNGGESVSKDSGSYLWLTPYAENPADRWKNPWNGNITIYWGWNSGSGQSISCNDAAIEVVVLSGVNVDSAKIERFTFDRCQTRREENNFSPGSDAFTDVKGRNFSYKAPNIPVTNGLLIRIVPLYFSTHIGAVGSVPLPNQGAEITSVGTLDTIQRKVKVFQSYPELPAELFPYSLLSL